MKIKEDSYYIESGCAGEVVHLSDMYDETKNGEPLFLGICIAFFAYAHAGYNYSVKNRMRHVWNIIKTGHPFKDELIFDINSARELRDKLDELINKAESVTK